MQHKEVEEVLQLTTPGEVRERVKAFITTYEPQTEEEELYINGYKLIFELFSDVLPHSALEHEKHAMATSLVVLDRWFYAEIINRKRD